LRGKKLHPSKALSNNWAEVTKIKRDLCKNVVKLITLRLHGILAPENDFFRVRENTVKASKSKVDTYFYSDSE